MSSARGSWGSWFEFLFSALGSMVGLGNIWRFPYVCYKSGGGAFLIPFIVSMVVCGWPLLFLETLYCQYSNLGPGKVWVVCPLFKGIGFGMMTMTSLVSIYYTMIMGWTLYYLGMSFSKDLPWSQCRSGWEGEGCSVMANGSTLAVTVPTTNDPLNVTLSDVTNNVSFGSGVETSEANLVNKSYGSVEEAFWFEDVLQVSSGIDEVGSIRWPLFACLLVAWVVVFLCLIKGIKSMGKVVYVAATLPYVILTALLVRACLLPGSSEGLYFYMVPIWEKLLDFEVWRNAATQVCFSIGMGFGLISTLASYNKFHNNCYRDAFILPVLDCATSVFAGLVVFSFLGYMAHLSGTSVDDVADEGPGLVFVAYPAALSTLPLPQLWSALFFTMLFCVGLDSQFMHVQGVTTALLDCFPELFMHRKTTLTLVVCCISFALGIPFTTQGGLYILNLVDWYIASFSVMIIIFLETVVLAWIYGTDRLYDDIQAMIGYKPVSIWKYAWKYISPIFVLVLWAAGLVKFKTIGSIYPGYPGWADGLGLVIAVLPILPVPVKMAMTLLNLNGDFKTRVRQSVKPSPLWKPAKSGDEEEEEEGMIQNGKSAPVDAPV